MVGLGKWEFYADTMFYNGNVYLIVSEKNGEYDVDIELSGVDVPAIEVKSVSEEGNTLKGIATSDMLRGKEIPFEFSVSADGLTANGTIKIPFMESVKLNNGKKV
ncbi:MAG: hypothetical protein LBR73_00640 [Oscillospiraceae bacterium]|jgi:hypothetical protein|nr:hypothetical protein [Oscillospiraceae bacterium]